MRRQLIYGLMAVVLISPAAAQSLRFATDPKAPIDIKAGLIDWHGDKQKADFSETAVFSQGPMQMSAQTMQLQLLADGTADSLHAQGAVALISKDTNGRILRRAFAEKAIYRPADELLVLTGAVEVRESGTRDGILRGHRLDIDMRSGSAALKGGGKKGRARIELR